MVCAAHHDPVAAIVLHSSPADIDTVIIDGVIRKHEGKLLDVNVNMGKEMWKGNGIDKDVLEWKEISRELVRRREVLQEKVKKIDMQAAKKDTMKAFYIDERIIVDRV